MSNIVAVEDRQILEDLRKDAKQQAERRLRARGACYPMLFGYGNDGPLLASSYSLETAAEQEHFRDSMRLLCVARNVHTLVVSLQVRLYPVDPVQVATQDPDFWLPFDGRESVVLLGETRGRQEDVVLPILSDEVGAFTGFGEPLFLSGSSALPFLFRPLVPSVPPSKQQQHNAERILKVVMST